MVQALSGEEIVQAMAGAMALHRQGQPREAALAYLALLQKAPYFAAAFNHLGLALLDLGRLEDALKAYDEALARQPDFPEALNNRGNVLQRLGRFDQAVEAYRRAIGLRSHYIEAFSNLGAALLAQGRLAAAIDAQRQALALNPAFPAAHNNLGKVLQAVGQVAEAEAAFRQALALRPDYPEAENNLANVLEASGRVEEALATYERVLARRPDFADVHLNYAMALLRDGRYRQGWAEYEWRWRTPRFAGRRLEAGVAEWDGAPLAGRRILLYAEQGLGDVLQFARFLPRVAERGGRVVLRVPPALCRLLRQLPGVEEVMGLDQPLPEVDCLLPLLSLPRLLEVDLETLPRDCPYLAADPVLAASWRDVLSERGLSEGSGLRVGLVWAGNPRPYDHEAHLVDLQRSLRLEQLAPLAAVPGVRFVSLQKGAPAVQVHMAPLPLIDVMDGVGDFADTAALVAALDLVISVDTSVAHLTGALGKPVWILSRFDGCWRWLRDRDDSPWYPTARLFRQTVPGDWAGVVERLVEALAAFRPQDG